MVILSSLVWDITCKNWFKFRVNKYYNFLEFSGFFHTWFNTFLWKDVAKRSPFSPVESHTQKARKGNIYHIAIQWLPIPWQFCWFRYIETTKIFHHFFMMPKKNYYDEKRWYKVPGYAYKQIIYNLPRLELVGAEKWGNMAKCNHGLCMYL